MVIEKIRLDHIIGLLVFLSFILAQFYNVSLIRNIDSELYEFGSGYVKTGDKGYNNVIVVNMDAESIPVKGQSPLFENKITELIETLNEKGANLIGLAVPLNPKALNPAVKEIKKLSAKIKAYPPADKSPDFKKWVLENLSYIEKKLGLNDIFPGTLKKGNNIIIPVTAGNVNNKNLSNFSDLSSANYLNALNISPSFRDKLKVNALVFPDNELMKNSKGFGHIISMPNESFDNACIMVFLSYRGNLIPSLPLRMAIAYNNTQPAQVLARENQLLIKDNPLHLIDGRLYSPVNDRLDDLPVFSYSDIMSNKKTPPVKGKVVFIGLEDNNSSVNEYRNRTSGLLAAKQFVNIINNNAVTRPFYMPYVESFLLFVFISIFVFFQTEKGIFQKTFYAFLMLIFITGTLILCFSKFGIWFKATHIIFGILIIYLYMIIKGDRSEKLVKESIETTRLLGLNLQSQGALDQAFEKFKKLPLDKETKDLIYNLGMEYEEKKLIGKALETYIYINKDGGFRDLDDKIPILKDSEEQSSTMGGYERNDDSGVLADQQGGMRSTVGRYKILGELGKGSMGLVYKAQDPKINRFVAIKTIRFSDEFDEDVILDIKERFFLEAEIAGKLSHPSIVIIHDVGDDQDLTYMAMELLEGEDLDKYIGKASLLPIRRVLDVIADIAEALDFAHKSDVIHRDIKPANIMLLKDGRVKVTDFGIAKAISSSKTKTGIILGTPNYMSPEQIMGQKINSKSDIFSLGILFYQLLTGELPFHGENLSGLLYQITQVKHSSPRNYNRKIPKVCEQIIDKALVKDPAKRFKTAGDMARIIRALADKIDQLRTKRASGE